MPICGVGSCDITAALPVNEMREQTPKINKDTGGKSPGAPARERRTNSCAKSFLSPICL